MNIIPFTPGMIPEAGKCYSGIPNDEYHAFIDWYSSSDLKNLDRSLAYFWQEFTRKKEETEKEYKLAFEVGTAYHEAVESLVQFGDLRLFEENVVSASFAGPKLTKEFHRVKAIYPKKAVIPEKTFGNIPEMAQKTKDAGDKLDLFHGGEIELSFFWVDPETGIQLKCRSDYFRPDARYVIDFKSTKDHNEKGFSKSIADFGYHFSAAMYMDGISQVFGETMERFVLIATANTKPFEVEFYYLNDVALDQGAAMYHQALADIAQNKPPEPTFKTIGVPFWALTKIEKEYR